MTLGQVKQFTDMDSHEEKLHNMIMQTKIADTKDIMKRKANEIDKTRVSKRVHLVSIVGNQSSLWHAVRKLEISPLEHAGLKDPGQMQARESV